MKKTGATAEQLRADIDNGRMSDMISGSHPATVPLGADEEAAGTPIPAATIAVARRQEPIGLPRVPPHRGLGHAWILVGVVVIIAFVIAACLVAVN